MGLKVSTLGSMQTPKSAGLKVSTLGTNIKNDGSMAGYLGQKAVIGLAGIGEGIYDFTVGGIYQLIGDKDYAKYLHDNDVVGEWNERLDKTYNPTGTVKVLGDIATGVGQALPSVAVGIATGGTSATAQLVGSTMLGMGYAGRGITDAVKQTGELGLKENIYGMATGALEGVTDAVLGGTQKAGKALWTTMRQGAKAGAGKIARNTLVKGILSSAASEATEEFLQEFADTALLRLTKVNREAEFSLSNALYSGFIGGITGGLLGGATGAVNATANLKRGLDVMARGNADTLIKTANYVRQNHVGNSKNYGNVTSEALRALTASVDAYNALADKNGNSAAVILGEIKVELAAFENAAGIDAIKAQMMERAPIELAAEASRRRGKTYTVEDIRKNTDGITEELALDSFVTGAFSDSSVDTKKAAIDEAIAEERMPYISQSAAWDGQSSASYRDPASGRYVFVEPSSEDGKWRLGFSATAIYDENDLRIKDGLDAESVKKALAGVADGSLVIGDNGIASREEIEAAKLKAKGKKARTAKKKAKVSQSKAKKNAHKEGQRNRYDLDGEVSKDAQKGAETAEGVEGAQVEDSEAKRAAEDEMKADGTVQVTEREQARGYSDEEADKARSVIKDFDLMSREKRLAIVDMMRSAKDAGASLSFMKHAAAMIGYWRKGLYIVCDGKTTEKGFWREFKDGSRLIVVNPEKADKGKNGINTVFLHELAHDVWSRASDATRKELYEMALEGTDKKEAADIRKKYENGYKQRGLKLDEGVIEEEIFTNLLSKTLDAEDFLTRFDMTPKRTSGLKRVVKSVVRMAKSFFGKDKYLYRRCESMAVAMAKVMGEQLLDLTGINQEKMQVVHNRYLFDDKKNKTTDYFTEDKYFKKQIDKWKELKGGSFIKVGIIKKGHPTNLVGMPDGMLRYDVSKLTKNMTDHTYLDEKWLKIIPKIIADPIAITEYKEENTINVFGNYFLDESPMMVAITISRDRIGNAITKVRTYNARRDVANIVNDDNILYLCENKEKTRKWFQAFGKPVPCGGNKFGFIRSISQNPKKSTPNAKKVPEKVSTKSTKATRRSLDEDFDTDTFFANALENGGVISHEEAEAMRGEKTKSQTTEKKPNKHKGKTKKQLSAEVKELRRDNRGLRKSNSKLGESVSRTQSANAKLREKNKNLTQAARAAESKAKKSDNKAKSLEKNTDLRLAALRARDEENIAREIGKTKKTAQVLKERYEKKVAHEQERMQRQTSEELKREGVEIMRITRNIDFLKNSVLHRKGTDGSVMGAKILSDPGILAFARVISSKADAYHILHETSRQAARVLLPCYKPENPLFGGNAIGELCKLEGENNLFSGYRPEIATAIETLANGKGQLSAYEIKLLDQVVGHIAHLYKTYDTVKVEGKRQSAITCAHSGYHDAIFARKATVKGDGKLGLKRLFKFLREGYLYTVITPEEVLRDVERHIKGGVLSTLFREVRLGEAEAGRIRATVLWDISEFLAKHKKFHKELDAERFEFGRGTDKIMISTAQAVGLYETSKREHARQRLFSEDEGIRIATADGEVKVMKVTEKMINELYKQFNEVDLEYIKLLEAAMDACKKYKIDTDMEVMGFTNAIDGHYYPITTDENYFAKDITDIRQSFGLEQTVKNKSFNQNTVAGAQAWLFIESAQKVLERHVFGVSQYAGLFIPLQNFGKVYGVKFDPHTKDGHTIDEDGNERVSVNGKTSLREYLNNTVWTDKGLDNYLTKLFADIQGISAEKSNVVDRFISFIRSGYVNSVFGLNPKIIATQLAAFPAAYRLIDADCLAGAFSLKPISDENRKAMDKYSRITLSRRFEGANAAEGLIDKLSDFGKKTSIGIEMTDRGTILALYSACQLQVAKNGGAEVGSEANLKAAADLLDNVLLDTQTTALQSDRSVLMRSKSEFAKILTMFKTEAMKSFSQMYSAISSYHDHKKMAELDSSYDELLENDKKRIGRNAGAYMVSAAWVAGLSIAFSKLYKIGKEDDEELGEAIVKECIGSAFDMLPIVSDIAAFMIDGYDVDSLPLSVINDSLNMLRDIGTVFDVEKSRGDKLKYVRQSAYTVGKLVGLPVQNTYKLARTATAIANRSAVYRLDNFFNGSPSYKSDLDRAIEGKNTRLAQTVISLYMSDKLSSSVSEEVAKELVRVYSAGGSLPRAIPSSLNRKERAVFANVYSGADTAIAELITSKEYKALDDAEKAKAIKDCYAEYYKMAKSAIGADN